jgi:4-nitrophenyl phosphatase
MRLGRPKQLLDWHGRPLIAHVVDQALEAAVGPVIVVLGCRAEEVRPALGRRPVQVAMNWRWAEGMSTSVQTGLHALPPDVDGALFLQCDQPLVTAELLRALRERWEEGDGSIVHPTHAGQRFSPVLFGRSHFADLARVRGDQGGRALIARHEDRVATVAVEDADTLADVDTPADYRRLRERHAAPAPETLLRRIRHLIVDMDGVLWHEDHPMPGLEEFFAFARRRRITLTLATNNSSRTPEQYVEKLAQFGIAVTPAEVLTSSLATAAYLADVAPAGSRVYAIGGEGLTRALEDRGFVLAEEAVDYVVVGWDQRLTWQKLATASLLIHAGAAFVGTNPDVSYPSAQGPVPGNGAQLAAIEVTTGGSPTVVGKPEPWMYREALARMDASPQATAVVGDRLDTDLEGGVRAGIHTVLVLSGIATEDDVARATHRPDLVYEHVGALTAAWKRALERKE